MIKMLVSARKTPGMTDEAYSRHWGEAHGDMVREHGYKMGFRRYIQTHLMPMDLPFGLVGTEGPDIYKNGQAELWWDSIDAMLRTGATQEGMAASRLFEADEKKFCDVANLSAFLADEHVLADRDPAARYRPDGREAKLVVELRRKGDGIAFPEWLESHRTYLERAGQALGTVRYIVNSPIADERFDFAKARGWKPAPDANVEIWFRDPESLHAAMSGEAADGWKADLARFGDASRLCPLIGRPRCIFDHVAAGK